MDGQTDTSMIEVVETKQYYCILKCKNTIDSLSLMKIASQNPTHLRKIPCRVTQGFEHHVNDTGDYDDNHDDRGNILPCDFEIQIGPESYHVFNIIFKPGEDEVQHDQNIQWLASDLAWMAEVKLTFFKTLSIDTMR